MVALLLEGISLLGCTHRSFQDSLEDCEVVPRHSPSFVDISDLEEHSILISLDLVTSFSGRDGVDESFLVEVSSRLPKDSFYGAHREGAKIVSDSIHTTEAEPRRMSSS